MHVPTVLSLFIACSVIEPHHTVGAHDAVVIACDGWFFRRFEMGGPKGILYPRATWTHAWRHFHLTGGAYALLDPPNWTAVKASKVPVSWPWATWKRWPS